MSQKTLGKMIFKFGVSKSKAIQENAPAIVSSGIATTLLNYEKTVQFNFKLSLTVSLE
jgi:hypothetical protein